MVPFVLLSGEITPVLDEYSAAEGIMTAGDVIEEVVLEMKGEFARDRGAILRAQKLSERDYVVSDRIDLH